MKAFELAFPVLSGYEGSGSPWAPGLSGSKRYRLTGCYGTAFPLGGGYLMTADHVLANVLASGQALLVGCPMELAGKGFPVTQGLPAERWPEVDLAVIQAVDLNFPALAWDVKELGTFTGVRALGYAFGLDIDAAELTVRGFTGSVAASRQFSGLKGNPWVYELTFPAPRGLSGGPLTLDRGPIVCGCVVGNLTTRMLVYADEERIAEGETKTIVERYEALNLGVAIRADTILGLGVGAGVIHDLVVQHGGKVEGL